MLAAEGRPRRFRRGEYLLREASTSSSPVVLIESGLVKIERSGESGRVVMLGVRGRGDVVGEMSALDGGPPSASAVALEPVVGRMLTMPEFRALLNDRAGLAAELATELSRRLRQLGASTSDTATRSVADRLLERMHEVSGRGAGESKPVRLPLTHQDLANWVGATRSAVGRSLSELRDQGKLEFGRGWVQLAPADD